MLRSRGNLLLDYETLRRILGLPEEIQIMGGSVPSHREQVVIRLGSVDPVPGLTWPHEPYHFISEVDLADYSEYLSQHYNNIYQQMQISEQDHTQEGEADGEEGA